MHLLYETFLKVTLLKPNLNLVINITHGHEFILGLIRWADLLFMAIFRDLICESN
jgi:hypothetical protein